MTGLTTTGEPVVPAAAGAGTTTGAICVAGKPTTVTKVSAGRVLATPDESATANDTVLTPGVSEVKVTDASNCW